MMKSRTITAIALTTAALLVSACSKNPFIVTRSNCPAVAVMAHTGTLTAFDGDNQTQEAVMYQANIGNVQRGCEQDEILKGTTTFTLSVRKGPGFKGGEITIPYFVALVRDNHLVTAKQVYETKIRFAPNSDTAATVETIQQTFDNVDMARRYHYELLVGFQLTPDQVAFNMMR